MNPHVLCSILFFLTRFLNVCECKIIKTYQEKRVEGNIYFVIHQEFYIFSTATDITTTDYKIPKLLYY